MKKNAKEFAELKFLVAIEIKKQHTKNGKLRCINMAQAVGVLRDMHRPVFIVFLIAICIICSISASETQEKPKSLSRKNSREKIELPDSHPEVGKSAKPSQCPYLKRLKEREAEEKRKKAEEKESKK